jgi:1-phosphofructokinase/tagatose 6-phosphate kinase
VSVVCPLGERNKDFFLEMARSDGLNVKVVPIPGFTRECCTLLDGKSGQTTELVVEEPVIDADSAPFEEKLMNLLRAELGLDGGTSCEADNTQKADALLFSGSRPPFWSAGIIKRIAAAAKDNGILFMADFRGNDLLSILDEYTPDIIKINEDEFWATFGDANATSNADSASTPRTEEQLSHAITETSRRLNNIVVVTRGSKPTLAAEKGKPYHSMSERVKAVNTIGCGDAYNAGFLYEYLATKDMEKSLEKGKWCASRNAESLRPGVLHD